MSVSVQGLSWCVAGSQMENLELRHPLARIALLLSRLATISVTSTLQLRCISGHP